MLILTSVHRSYTEMVSVIGMDVHCHNLVHKKNLMADIGSLIKPAAVENHPFPKRYMQSCHNITSQNVVEQCLSDEY